MDKVIQTPCGPIRGCDCQWEGVTAFKGIRYATAQRWKYPVQVTGWEGEYDATRYGACSYQPRAFYNEEDMPEKAFYYNEFRKGETYRYSEDCLFLNIWTPAGAEAGAALPVLVYIHGGGFTGGCGHEKHFDGPVWAAKGVVSVTLNYRLGPMGFACLPQLAEESGHTGNYGLFDQLTAIRWVYDNISAFGGDPARITIMGQSAGAMSVQQLVLSPLTRGLVAGAVMSSGGGVNRMFSPAAPEKTYDFWQNIMKQADCATLEEFRVLEPEKLFDAWDKVKAVTKGMILSCGPCLDGQLVVGDSEKIAKSGGALNIPYMAGSNSEDIMTPFMFQMAKGWNRLQADQGRHSCYTWFFDRNVPGDNNGAWHSGDLWYWFGTLDNCWRPMTEKDRALSGQMSDYLTNFVKTGNPNGENLPEWLPTEKGQRRVLRLGEKATHMGGVNMAKLTKTMLTVKPVGE